MNARFQTIKPCKGVNDQILRLMPKITTDSSSKAKIKTIVVKTANNNFILYIIYNLYNYNNIYPVSLPRSL